MLSRIDLRQGRLAGTDLRAVLPRAEVTVASAVEAIAGVCDDVRDRGLPAVREATERFDKVSGGPVRVPVAELAKAADALEPALRAAITEAIRRARLVHAAQRREDVTVTLTEGATVTERWVPVRRVGLYVPGGLVAYPSSVVMNVVPAQVAGVRSIAVTSPPKAEFGGLPNPTILAACHLLGVDEVYAVGGAQAVALFAHGAAGDEQTPAVERVDLVTGPGNVFVTAAKRYLQGIIGIDSEAGPTEIGILADHTADPAFVAADLVAQAEHDENAACLLVTDSPELLDAVEVELDKQVPATRHTERVQKALAAQAACVLVDDLDDGLIVVDEWAAEHLEVITADARERAARVTNAGAVFVGAYSPVSLGDYLAGSNHVLPTSGTAKHSSGLSVQSFLRGIHVVDYSREALAQVAPHVTALGTAEGLLAHVDAVQVRVR